MIGQNNMILPCYFIKATSPERMDAKRQNHGRRERFSGRRRKRSDAFVCRLRHLRLNVTVLFIHSFIKIRKGNIPIMNVIMQKKQSCFLDPPSSWNPLDANKLNLIFLNFGKFLKNIFTKYIIRDFEGFYNSLAHENYLEIRDFYFRCLNESRLNNTSLPGLS